MARNHESYLVALEIIKHFFRKHDILTMVNEFFLSVAMVIINDGDNKGVNDYRYR